MIIGNMMTLIANQEGHFNVLSRRYYELGYDRVR